MTELALLDLAGVQRVLCIAAHPDDLEYGTSCAVAGWTHRGIEVSYLLLTAGEAGIRDLEPSRTGPARAREQAEACRLVGVQDLRILSHPDGLLVAGPELRRDIAAVIRQVRPQVVVVPSWELEVGWGLNHADHRAGGIATVDACRDADNPWIFPELGEQGLAPWHVSRLLVAGHSSSSHLVAVSPEALQAGIDSLSAHRLYLAALPEHPAPATLLPELTAQAGAVNGLAHAVAFRSWPL